MPRRAKLGDESRVEIPKLAVLLVGSVHLIGNRRRLGVGGVDRGGGLLVVVARFESVSDGHI